MVSHGQPVDPDLLGMRLRSGLARRGQGRGLRERVGCLPARNEAATVGAIIESIRDELMGNDLLVDELLVIDDHSTDQTAAVAVAAGAEVVSAADVLPGFGTRQARARRSGSRSTPPRAT